MNISTKPYKIAVYDDRYENGQLKEYRLGVIGANDMDSPNRALEPTLTRNVNGVKKLTFKMYKRYIDTITGEETENPFVDWLVSERKVKLNYDNKWYDFIIKDINESSSNYLYTYTLEDALVQELSKNGFGVVLDAELMNNIGNANKLAEQVLDETDWDVAEDSEVFVQTIEEALVYVTLPPEIEDNGLYQILDQSLDNLTEGVTEKRVGNLYPARKTQFDDLSWWTISGTASKNGRTDYYDNPRVYFLKKGHITKPIYVTQPDTYILTAVINCSDPEVIECYIDEKDASNQVQKSDSPDFSYSTIPEQNNEHLFTAKVTLQDKTREFKMYFSGSDYKISSLALRKESEWLDGKTALAFYSSCKNKPHRFQFIYSQNGYNLDNSGYAISRKDDRTINEKDCQYYIDFENPEVYKTPTGSNAKALGLLLPEGFDEGYPGTDVTKTPNTSDSTLSSWYRGKRYGFAQQAEYIPVLERYCQKFKRQEKIALIEDSNIFLHGSQDKVTITTEDMASNLDLGKELAGCINAVFSNKNSEVATIDIKKKHKWVGLRLELDHHDYDEYLLKYSLTVNYGKLVTIGGHNSHYEPISYKVFNSSGTDLAEKLVQTESYVTFTTPLTSGTYNVEIRYKKRVSTDGQKDLFLQPNRGTETYIDCKISNLSLTMVGDYLGYTESNFVSPTLIQNYITNYKFESDGGWTATASSGKVSKERATVESTYGRFGDTEDGDETNKLITISEDFYASKYSEDRVYKARLKMLFFNNDQFVLNSGIRDNRTLVAEMPKNEKWVLDYKIVNDIGNPIEGNDFNITLGEYIYDSETGGYNERTGFINYSYAAATGDDEKNIPDGYIRKIITVSNSTYTKETFKKNSKIYLKIQPTEVETTTVNDEKIPCVWYLEGISLYRRAVDENGNIIIPDYELEDNTAAQEYVKQGTIERKYHYFNENLIKGDNAITDKEKLLTIVKDALTYIDYKPVYNEGAEKIRTITAKESNYFNILQSIAETFEAWLDLEITRDSNTGAVTAKKVRFKNYVGKNNYANFRYGVNLKDIQRTYSSKNIATKLIVKQNNNELAKNGFCTISRSGANPTGENYIYDFQYYQNTGIMDPSDYLNTVYYPNGAIGPDAELWNDTSEVEVSEYEDWRDTTLNGYYQRVKRINDTLLPINEEIIGYSTDLVKKKAELEVAEATKEAATEGIEQTAENFLALTGVYPEEAQTGQITSITLNTTDNTHGITKSEEWWYVDTDPVPSLSDLKVTTKIKISGYEKTCAVKAVADQDTTLTDLIGDGIEIEKGSAYSGVYLEEQWEDGRVYTLTYTLKVSEDDESKLINIGGHPAKHRDDSSSGFDDYTINVKCKEKTDDGSSKYVELESDVGDKTIVTLPEKSVGPYYVTVKGTYKSTDSTPNYSGECDLWIQPNRGVAQDDYHPIKCEITDIKLTKTITAEEAVTSHDRKAHFSLHVNVGIGKDGGGKSQRTIPRTYYVTCVVPANATGVTVEQGITSVDTSSSSVKKYIDEYTLYHEKLNSSTADVTRVKPQIDTLEQAIKGKETRRKTLLDYKKKLNELFFKKYSRFILEGTWISEEHVDDDKYFADAQSVLYNSCYPQVAYNINVISLKGLPGYKLIDFDLGDKTNVIDEQFFGNKLQEEVVITEMSEMLDNPSKNTIKVQNFKNQFQDLFQKITATVQQTQYNVGSYEKGAALVDANYKKQNEWITKAINNAESYLQYGQTVVSDNSGITIVDSSNKQNKLRLVGGAILFSVEKPDQSDTTWMTGITNSGISANLITAGRLDTGAVQIMSGDSPVFRWDAYGISAYDALWNKTDQMNLISGVNTKKFVRFDKNGIYGINNEPGIDGAVWYPSDNSIDGKTALEQIDEKATFALTWEGLKVTGNEGIVARMGKLNGSIFKITNEGQPIIDIQNDGVSKIGNLTVNSRVSENLVTDDAIGLYPPNTDGVELTPNEDGSYTVTCTATNQPNVGLSIGTEKLLFEKNQNYIIKYKFKIEKKPKDDEITLIAGHQTEFAILAATVDGVQQNITSGNAYNDGFAIEDAEGKIHTVEMLVCYTNPSSNTAHPGLYIQPQRQPADTDGNADYSIIFQVSDIEVKWATLTESADSPNFSWKFCPVDGMFMWNGHQGSGKITGETSEGESVDSNLVFRINNDNLYMRGTVIAEKGKIAGWTIDEGKLTTGTLGTNGFHMYTSGYGSGNFFGAGGSRNWALGVGKNFGVTDEGSVYCKSLNATGGTIAGWKLNDGYFGTLGTPYNDYQNRWNNLEENAGVRLDQKYFRQASRIPVDIKSPLTDSFTISWSGNLGAYKSTDTDRQSKLPYFFLGNYHYEDNNKQIGSSSITTKKSNLLWTPEEFTIQNISKTGWDNGTNPETATNTGCREKPIWLKFSKEGLRIYTPNYSIIDSDKTATNHGLLIDDTSIQFCSGSSDPKVLISGASTKLTLTKSTYLDDDTKNSIPKRLSTLSDSISGLDKRLNNLGFKSPCDIVETYESSTRVIGKVWQLGTIVYGFIRPRGPNGDWVNLNPNSWTFKNSNGTDSSFPYPYAGMTINVVYFGGDGNTWIRTVTFNTSGNRFTSGHDTRPDNAKWNEGAPEKHWTYFAYSSNSDHHPD